MNYFHSLIASPRCFKALALILTLGLGVALGVGIEYHHSAPRQFQNDLNRLLSLSCNPNTDVECPINDVF